MNSFYVYMYLTPNGIPFYIGKGKGKRVLVSQHLATCQSSEFLKRKIRKIGQENVKIHFLHEHLSEEEAFYWEQYWIKYIGRRDLKEGTLCNLTDGGEGSSGYVRSKITKCKVSESLKGHAVSKETRKKISDATKGRVSPLKNRHHSVTTRNKISKSNKGRSVWNKGIPRSEETKRKISEANKGRVRSEETKRKISETLLKKSNKKSQKKV